MQRHGTAIFCAAHSIVQQVAQYSGTAQCNQLGVAGAAAAAAGIVLVWVWVLVLMLWFVGVQVCYVGA